MKKFVFFSLLTFNLAVAAPFCIHIKDVPYKKSNRHVLESLLNALPDASFRLDPNGYLSIFSGGFVQREHARLLLPLIQSRYPSARLVACPLTTPFTGKLPEPAREVTQKPESGVLEKRAADARLHHNKTAETFDMAAVLLSRLEGRRQDGGMASLFFSESTLPDFDAKEPGWRTGWYIRNNVGFDFVNDDTSYDVRLEWDLFKEGYMAARQHRLEAKKRQLWRRWNDTRYVKSVRKRRISGCLKRYRYEALKELEGVRYAFYRYLYKEAKKALQQGELTRFDLRDLNASLQESEDRLTWYESKPRAKMPSPVWRLFARSETLRLKPEKKLFAGSQNGERETDKLLRTRSQWERWSDRLKLNLYAGYRNLYVNQDQALVGFDAKIPLFVDDEAEKMDDLYYAKVLQREAEEAQLRREDFGEKKADFHYHQRRIRALKRRLDEIGVSLKELSEIEQSRFAPYAKDLYRQKEALVRRYLDRLRDLISVRFDALEDLFSLALLAQTEPQKLLKKTD